MDRMPRIVAYPIIGLVSAVVWLLILAAVLKAIGGQS